MIPLYWSLLLFILLKYISCYNECGPRINVSGAEGGGASLPVKLQEEVKDIAWIRSDNHFATTKPNGQITIRSGQFRGRLRSETDASLIIADLTNQDQGIYSANVLYKSHSLCNQLYDLQVYNNTAHSVGNYTHQNIIRLGLASVILIITSYLIIQHFHAMKRENALSVYIYKKKVCFVYPNQI
ncbi:hypothetical protein XELAEV_18040630mg [Xenopus laevis]|uniref:Immunoglobulin V-set domain-containing protein n=1 Tax=Xenopus laevis TaxID=8355 RepID=A0A974CB13_XENLA|nr:hypothetical protein XELAEV_18040630mg [Xenopus laevis]